MADEKKPSLSLVIGAMGGKPKGEPNVPEAPADESVDRRKQAGKALAAALARRDGDMIMDALDEALDVLMGDDEEEEELEEEPLPEEPMF